MLVIQTSSTRNGSSPLEGTHVVVVLFHCHNPRHVVKCDGAQSEVCVVRDLADFFNKAAKIRRGNAIYCSDKIGW